MIVPNPANDHIQVNAAGNVSRETTVKIFSAEGKLVYSGMLEDMIDSPVDISGWSTGIYFVNAIDEKKVVIAKLAIMH